MPTGSSIPNQTIKEMKALRDLGVPLSVIGRKYGVQADTVARHIIPGRAKKMRAAERVRNERKRVKKNAINCTDPIDHG